MFLWTDEHQLSRLALGGARPLRRPGSPEHARRGSAGSDHRQGAGQHRRDAEDTRLGAHCLRQGVGGRLLERLVRSGALMLLLGREQRMAEEAMASWDASTPPTDLSLEALAGELEALLDDFDWMTPAPGLPTWDGAWTPQRPRIRRSSPRQLVTAKGSSGTPASICWARFGGMTGGKRGGARTAGASLWRGLACRSGPLAAVRAGCARLRQPPWSRARPTGSACSCSTGLAGCWRPTVSRRRS